MVHVGVLSNEVALYDLRVVYLMSVLAWPLVDMQLLDPVLVIMYFLVELADRI
jgi:hypothetical protein